MLSFRPIAGVDFPLDAIEDCAALGELTPDNPADDRRHVIYRGSSLSASKAMATPTA